MTICAVHAQVRLGQRFSTWQGPPLRLMHWLLSSHMPKSLPEVYGMLVQKQQVAEEQQHQQNGKAKMPEDFDHAADRHRGQLALRKLYHESDRLLLVLYTSPSCGPCRTLKPIFSKVVDDYPGKVHRPPVPSSGPAENSQDEPTRSVLSSSLRSQIIS